MAMSKIAIEISDMIAPYHAVTAILPLPTSRCEFEGHSERTAHAIVVKTNRDSCMVDPGHESSILACRECAMENAAYIEDYRPGLHNTEQLAEDPSVQVVS